MSERAVLVTLLTDFGTADYFVGAMKGAVLSVNPQATVIDLTHEIPAHDVQAGAFTLNAASETFPPGTVHVAVVDPGVGSSRRPIVVAGGAQFFVGPDNGLFSYVYERLGEFRVFEIADERFFRPQVSATFHGRDLFAPVAGALSRGVSPDALGRHVSDFVRLPHSRPSHLPDGTLEASIIHIDRFGNCITNISPQDLTADDILAGARLRVGAHEISSFRRFFAEGEEAGGAPFAIWGSAGLLEIAVNLDSAARLLDVRRGDAVRVVVPSSPRS